MKVVTKEQVSRGELDPKLLLSVLTAVKKGDFSARMPLDWTGIDGKIADTLNDIIALNDKTSLGIDRISKVVGKEGKLATRIPLGSVGGAWARQIESVNTLISDLVWPSTEMARVIGAVAKGDMIQKMDVEVDGKPIQGEFMRTAKIVNTMVDQLGAFAGEVTRVAREVGTEGKLGGQAQVVGVAGIWNDLTVNVNLMAANLTNQVRNIAVITAAVVSGDLSQKITVDAKGEVLALKNTVNTMVDQLGAFAGEVTRVAREVGTEGKLGGQAQVVGVAGIWNDLTVNVNLMAANLTNQVRNIAVISTAVVNGDMSQKITVDAKGELLALKNTVNTMVDQLGAFAGEVTRVAREVGTEGKLGGQAQVVGVAGIWNDLTVNVNLMAANLTNQVRAIAVISTAVVNGDMSQKITVDAKGELLALKNTVNTMVDQLGAFAGEVTRVAREVGTEGKLGGQAQVVGVAGIWNDLTVNVNLMAANLTNQVRNIAVITAAVVSGDLSQKITVDAKGEVLALKNTVNTMVDQLGAFAGEVTRVAREVGTEGKLGGQAQVVGVAGIWNDLTVNVNLMAANLTDQVRAIAVISTAVVNGDMSKKITVDAKGELLALKNTVNTMVDQLGAFAGEVTRVAREVGTEGKLGGQAQVVGVAGIWNDLTDNINAMIRSLKDTTDKNTEQDWLKTNLARFTRLLQGQREMLTVCKLILSEVAPLVNAQHGVFYGMEGENDNARLGLQASYAYKERKNLPKQFRLGEGLVGECALQKQRILLTNVPSDYVQISSGLGEATPMNVVVLPVMFGGVTKAVIELASFERFSPIHLAFLEQLTESIGIVLNTIEADSRTEALLQQSQKMTLEMQTQGEELQQTNVELESAKTVAEKANLAKSDFLSSMSHELRSPLNAILGFAQLMESDSQPPTPAQKESIAQILQAGWHLLKLINEILDLAKVESGQVPLSKEPVSLAEVMLECQAMIEPQAQQRDIKLSFPQFDIPCFVRADRTRLKQVLINLLSNAIKYNREHGAVEVNCTASTPERIRISIKDNGAGLPPEQLAQLFQPFNRLGQEAGGEEGTGIGLVVAKQLVELMGGTIGVESTVGVGSVFWFELISIAEPRLAMEGGDAAASAQPHVPRGARPHTLLYVEDNPANLKLVEQIIVRHPDLSLLTAVNGNLGIELARDEQPDVILMDINLPGINGYEALKILREDPATAHIPVIAVSANAMHLDVERGLKAGFFRYITKPIKVNEFMEALDVALEFAEQKVGQDK
ncbi:MAG: HAMP domain-containing protein [Sulfuricella sp.]